MMHLFPALFGALIGTVFAIYSGMQPAEGLFFYWLGGTFGLLSSALCTALARTWSVEEGL